MKKTYAQKINQTKRKELLEKIEDAISFHEKLKTHISLIRLHLQVREEVMKNKIKVILNLHTTE